MAIICEKCGEIIDGDDIYCLDCYDALEYKLQNDIDGLTDENQDLRKQIKNLEKQIDEYEESI